MIRTANFAILLLAAPAVAGSPLLAGPDASPSSPEPRAPLRERLAEGWSHLGDDGLYLLTPYRRVTRKGLGIASGLASGIGLLVLLDDEIREEIVDGRSRRLDRWERRIEPFGHARNTALGAGAVYAAGRLARHEPTAETGRCLLEALLFTEGLTMAAKGIFGRAPPGEGHRAGEFFDGSSFFPSGHTARSFAVATVLAERHGRTAAGVAYPVATLVGLSRLQRDVHWASDVLAGAALGHVIARAIVDRRERRRDARKARIGMTPQIGSDRTGVRVGVRLVWE